MNTQEWTWVIAGGVAVAFVLARRLLVRRAPADVVLEKIKAGAKNFHECGGTSAYFGAPATATADDGHRLLDILAELSEAALMEDAK